MKGFGRNPNNNRNFFIWSIIIVVVMLFYQALDNTASASKVVFSDFLDQVQEGAIRDVIIKGDMVAARTYDGKYVATIIPYGYHELVATLREKGVGIEAAPLETPMGAFIGILLSWFPVLLLIGVWLYLVRNMQGGGSKALGFGKSKAQLITKDKNKVTFADVAGVEEAKNELVEIVDFLKDPRKFQRLGGKIPKGCLLVGYPGTGKTMLAKAVAGEANVPFFTISGSDFVEMFVGVGASRVRDMFTQAKKNAPCIVFIDEIDAVGRHRGAGLGGGNDEREQTLNQLLVEMDGFAENQGVIIIAATNRPDVLDPALLRPGRFDRQVTVSLPDLKGREAIFKVHMRSVPTDSTVDPRVLAKRTPGSSGADIANVINEAALRAALHNKTTVGMPDIEEAMDKVQMGPRRLTVLKEDERRLTAYHESGHAIVSFMIKVADKIHKMTIQPRGRALGMVMQLPEDDVYSITKEQLYAKIAVAMGGRAAEEIIFGPEKVTSGASSDIKAATQLARKMVTQFGFSKEIGNVLVGDEKEEVFLGHSLGHQKSISEELARTVDHEIKRIIDECYKQAWDILKANIDKMHKLADAVLEKEILTGAEVEAILTENELAKPENETLKKQPKRGKKQES